MLKFKNLSIDLADDFDDEEDKIINGLTVPEIMQDIYEELKEIKDEQKHEKKKRSSKSRFNRKRSK